MCFLNESLIRLDNNFEELADCITMNSLIQSWIFNTMDPKVSKKISYMGSQRPFGWREVIFLCWKWTKDSQTENYTLELLPARRFSIQLLWKTQTNMGWTFPLWTSYGSSGLVDGSTGPRNTGKSNGKLEKWLVTMGLV